MWFLAPDIIWHNLCASIRVKEGYRAKYCTYVLLICILKINRSPIINSVVYFLMPRVYSSNALLLRILTFSSKYRSKDHLYFSLIFRIICIDIWEITSLKGGNRHYLFKLTSFLTPSEVRRFVFLSVCPLLLRILRNCRLPSW